MKTEKYYEVEKKDLKKYFNKSSATVSEISEALTDESLPKRIVEADNKNLKSIETIDSYRG